MCEKRLHATKLVKRSTETASLCMYPWHQEQLSISTYSWQIRQIKVNLKKEINVKESRNHRDMSFLCLKISLNFFFFVCQIQQYLSHSARNNFLWKKLLAIIGKLVWIGVWKWIFEWAIVNRSWMIHDDDWTFTSMETKFGRSIFYTWGLKSIH